MHDDIQKDRLLEVLEEETDLRFSLPLNGVIAYRQIAEKLAAHIRFLLDKDFNQVIYILYRVDVPEQKVTEMLHNHPEQDAGSMIAGLILERTLQKIHTRQQFNNSHGNIPDDEKW
ncbi:MAG: hypothetical protein EPN37_00915 [Chitinophagaceae bacterium]|nr:MAG: hypothetical protein EPN37_00915 [Chitinophagaceae bacterium]